MANCLLQFNLEQAAPVEEQYLESTLKQVVSRPYNVATGLKIQATLIPIKQQAQDAAAEVNILVINLHYSVADGWSMGVLFRDLSRAYNMLKLGEGMGHSC